MAAATRLDTLQPVELADGVEIQLRVAGPAVRSTAWLIDLLIFSLIMLFGLLLLNLVVAGWVGHEISQGFTALFLFSGVWFYNVFFEAGKKGATPGQRWMKLRVASITGGPVTVSQAVLRNFLRVIDFMPFMYLTGFLACLFTRRFQRLGDLVAGTVMVYADSPPLKKVETQIQVERLAPPVVLSREEQAALHQFIERAPHWSDERRVELANLVEPLTQASGMGGLRRLCGMALWLQAPDQK